MNWRMVSTLVSKDLTLFFRDRFFAIVTVLGLVAFVAMYFILPSTVDEELTVGLYAPTLPPGLEEQLLEGGLIIVAKGSEDALKAGMAERQYSVGVVLPAGIIENLAAGQKDQVTVYITSDFPVELKDAYAILFQELAYELTGQPLNVRTTAEFLGKDMAGQQIPMRDRMIPLLAVFVMVMETMGLASLITSEVEGGTLRALLVTPLRLEGLFLGKGVTGVGLTFVQALIITAIIGGLSHQPLLVLVILFLGALLFTGIGFLMASLSRDMMGVVAWGVLAILVLSVPAFSILLPGTISGWIKVLPSYYLVDALNEVINYGAGLGDVWQSLLMLFGFSVAFFVLGIVVLGRRLE